RFLEFVHVGNRIFKLFGPCPLKPNGPPLFGFEFNVITWLKGDIHHSSRWMIGVGNADDAGRLKIAWPYSRFDRFWRRRRFRDFLPRRRTSRWWLHRRRRHACNWRR